MNSIIAFENCEQIKDSYINPKDIEINDFSDNESENTSSIDMVDNNVVNKLHKPETPNTNTNQEEDSIANQSFSSESTVKRDINQDTYKMLLENEIHVTKKSVAPLFEPVLNFITI
ncbi:24364_t:CDS:2 [Racocetra persica]|uniref:24364_t:CDS:1 n=1 Tax=Racocetra persica TaxID=160502 RepID=A0ACA9KMI4_9GLOM|nr:24364_t:CDS:2 [Racocetra persica]